MHKNRHYMVYTHVRRRGAVSVPVVENNTCFISGGRQGGVSCPCCLPAWPESGSRAKLRSDAGLNFHFRNLYIYIFLIVLFSSLESAYFESKNNLCIYSYNVWNYYQRKAFSVISVLFGDFIIK